MNCDTPTHSVPQDGFNQPVDLHWMRRALALARRGMGHTCPNPMVGAVLVRDGQLLGHGWHHRAGLPHAEIEAIRDARSRGHDLRGATLYVTLEPCSTHGRTPPCTEAIIAAGINRVVVAATDPNPAHAGRGLDLLRQAGVGVQAGLLAETATELNVGFNHWILHNTPFVTLKAGLTLDGKIATRTGESRWITSARSRLDVMRLRRAHDAILVGIGTVLADNPRLTVRLGNRELAPWRIVLDTHARTPLEASLLNDPFQSRTRIVVGESAPGERVRQLRERAQVWIAPERDGRVDLPWVMQELGRLPITRLLVEGGGTVHAAFLAAHLAQRIRFYYAPMVVGGSAAPRAVAGPGFQSLAEVPRLGRIRHRLLGGDLLIEAEVNGACSD
jgi:diaminohydroxyphosphoribosylaminopyrimidine deaminase/5-amino-6-(5-phosphoribosylamino)uracil reductase